MFLRHSGSLTSSVWRIFANEARFVLIFTAWNANTLVPRNYQLQIAMIQAEPFVFSACFWMDSDYIYDTYDTCDNYIVIDYLF